MGGTAHWRPADVTWHLQAARHRRRRRGRGGRGPPPVRAAGGAGRAVSTSAWKSRLAPSWSPATDGRALRGAGAGAPGCARARGRARDGRAGRPVRRREGGRRARDDAAAAACPGRKPSCCARPTRRGRGVGPGTPVDAARLAAAAPSPRVVGLDAESDLQALGAAGLRLPCGRRPRRRLGPAAAGVVRRHAAGLKVGEAMTRARRRGFGPLAAAAARRRRGARRAAAPGPLEPPALSGRPRAHPYARQAAGARPAVRGRGRMVESAGPRQPAAAAVPRPAAPPRPEAPTKAPAASPHGLGRQAQEPDLLAAAQGLRDLRAGRAMQKSSRRSCCRCSPRFLTTEDYGVIGMVVTVYDLPRRLRHSRLRRRLHALLLRRQEPQAPRQDHHPRLLRRLLLSRDPARRPDRLHAADLGAGHGRAGYTISSTSVVATLFFTTSATCRSRCCVSSTGRGPSPPSRSRACSSRCDGARVPRRVPLGPAGYLGANLLTAIILNVAARPIYVPKLRRIWGPGADEADAGVRHSRRCSPPSRSSSSSSATALPLTTRASRRWGCTRSPTRSPSRSTSSGWRSAWPGPVALRQAQRAELHKRMVSRSLDLLHGVSTRSCWCGRRVYLRW